VNHILQQHPHISTINLSGIFLMDNNVRTLVLLCELRVNTFYTQTLLVEYRAKKKGGGDQAEAKEEILLGASLDRQEKRVWSVGPAVAGTAD